MVDLLRNVGSLFQGSGTSAPQRRPCSAIAAQGGRLHPFGGVPAASDPGYDRRASIHKNEFARSASRTAEPVRPANSACCSLNTGVSPIAVSTSIIITSLATLAALGTGSWALRAWRMRQQDENSLAADTALTQPVNDVNEASAAGDSGAGDPPKFVTAATQAIADRYDDLAFSLVDIEPPIGGEHDAVLERITQNVATSIHQPEYFPRRPLLLPKLLQTLNDSESTRQELVRLLLDDPSLAGSVLQRANSAFYRLSPMPIDSLDGAVRTLGTDGLRGLVASMLFQPVFRLPRGCFDDFAKITWEHAQRAARAAETCARSAGDADPFVAQLLGLLTPLARIVMFRLAMDTYRAYPGLSPNAEVFIQALRQHAPRVSRLIASSWALPDPSIRALDEQLGKGSPLMMSPFGRCLYYGELCAMAAMLDVRDMQGEEDTETVLMAQGLTRQDAQLIQRAAVSSIQE